MIINEGSFIPETIENVLKDGYSSPYYRNPFLISAMVNLNMIDTVGSGIKRVYDIQKKKYFPMPDYDLSNPNRVIVTLYGKIIDENYSRLLFERTNLDISSIILLDRLQKRYTISKQQSDYLKKEHLIEGRYPNIYISSSLASLTEKKEEYVYNSGLENEFYMELIIKYIKEYGSASRNEIISLLKDKLPNSLDENTRNQLALDRYIESRKKSKWAIGRDYEMFIGHEYEKKGYKVTYTGITDRLEDKGRDIIAQKDNEILIIQCKNWSKYKEIHENHICQLFGTTVQYNIENNLLFKATPVFITSATLSETALKFAEYLGVQVIQNKKLEEFPRIKCNINNKEKIYHLPFDQQYDRTIIGDQKGEFFAWTVQEAVDKGFRRAKKYFYVKYKNEHPDEEVDELLFTYPGPNPFTREQAIFMMADATEAASRSLPDYTEKSIRELVNRLIDGMVAEGFFRECPITFRDITYAKTVLCEKLKTIYHARVSYPTAKA